MHLSRWWLYRKNKVFISLCYWHLWPLFLFGFCLPSYLHPLLKMNSWEIHHRELRLRHSALIHAVMITTMYSDYVITIVYFVIMCGIYILYFQDRHKNSRTFAHISLLFCSCERILHTSDFSRTLEENHRLVQLD